MAAPPDGLKRWRRTSGVPPMRASVSSTTEPAHEDRSDGITYQSTVDSLSAVESQLEVRHKRLRRRSKLLPRCSQWRVCSPVWRTPPASTPCSQDPRK